MSSRRSRNGGIKMGKTLQAIVEIATEMFLINFLRQIHVRGGDHADIRANCPCASQPFEFSLLKHTQQLGLKLKGNIADLVEENSPTVCQLESADAL